MARIFLWLALALLALGCEQALDIATNPAGGIAGEVVDTFSVRGNTDWHIFDVYYVRAKNMCVLVHSYSDFPIGEIKTAARFGDPDTPSYIYGWRGADDFIQEVSSNVGVKPSFYIYPGESTPASFAEWRYTLEVDDIKLIIRSSFSCNEGIINCDDYGIWMGIFDNNVYPIAKLSYPADDDPNLWYIVEVSVQADIVHVSASTHTEPRGEKLQKGDQWSAPYTQLAYWLYGVQTELPVVNYSFYNGDIYILPSPPLGTIVGIAVEIQDPSVTVIFFDD